MRCKKCKREVREGKAKSWERNECPACFNKKCESSVINQEKIYSPNQIRLKTNPVDVYLDQGTLYELEVMNR